MHIPDNAAIVFDIDHTLLDWVGNPIHPIVYLYHAVRSKGIHPVIITARWGSQRNIEWTRQQLQNAGINGWKFMYFLPENKRDPVHYKRVSRKNVHERGLHVIMSIGDEYWDIGEYGGHGIIVPKCTQCSQ
jgi:predicted secreted acid phosphatase